ncbi:MAG: glycosyltransferase family 4 protein [Deltaproteobacteria bacterium]|nr:glycosyltransferase family 4 protein [Deltaproteobacteria bacterium]
MKIGIISEYYYPTLGGIQEHVHHFAQKALVRGHDVRIITPRVRGAYDRQLAGSHAVPVIHVGRSIPIYNNGSIARMALGYKLGNQLQHIFENEAFDIIHIHAPLTPMLPLLALTRSPTTTIGTLHTNFEGSLLLRLFQKKCQQYLNRLNGLIAVSPAAARPLASYFQTNCRIIPNGIDVSQFHPDLPRRSEFDDGRINLLWVGRIEPRNGLDRMIKAFILASQRCPNLRLIIVGDGPLRPTFEAMVPTAYKPFVYFSGFINASRPSYYASADMLCVPTSISSFGITLLEGMAAGIPIIASDIDGFRDVMTQDREGVLIDTANINTFAETIEAIANDKSLALNYGMRGRQTAINFSWDRVTEKIIDYYREIKNQETGQTSRLTA